MHEYSLLNREFLATQTLGKFVPIVLNHRIAKHAFFIWIVRAVN